MSEERQPEKFEYQSVESLDAKTAPTPVPCQCSDAYVGQLVSQPLRTAYILSLNIAYCKIVTMHGASGLSCYSLARFQISFQLVWKLVHGRNLHRNSTLSYRYEVFFFDLG